MTYRFFILKKLAPAALALLSCLVPSAVAQETKASAPLAVPADKKAEPEKTPVPEPSASGGKKAEPAAPAPAAPPPLRPLSAGTASPAAKPGGYRLETIETGKLPKLYMVVDQAAPQSELKAAEFLMRHGGKTADAATGTVKFRETGQGIALVVALDASGSMRGKPMEAIRQGLATLVQRKREEDRIAVMSFANDVRWEARWNAERPAVEDALRKLAVRGNQTHLYDAIDAALSEFASRGELPGRRAILVISDGLDEGSTATLPGLVNRLRDARVRFDAAGMANDPRWFPRLRELTAAGYGEFQAAADTAALTRILDLGIERLLDYPTLEFEAEDLDRDGKLQSIGVEHNPTAWRNELRLTIPEAPLWERRNVQIGAGVGLVLLLAGAFVTKRGGGKAKAPPLPATAAPMPLPRAPTVTVHLPRKTEAMGGAGDNVHLSRPKPPPTPVERIPYSTPPQMPVEPLPAAPAAPATKRVATVFAGTAAGPTAPKLRVVSGPHAGQLVPVNSHEFWLGSAPNNHLVLASDQGVSGNHACIRTEGSFLRLFDQGSRNGTYVNGAAIGQTVTLLRVGDVMRLGSSEVRLEA